MTETQGQVHLALRPNVHKLLKKIVAVRRTSQSETVSYLVERYAELLFGIGHEDTPKAE